MVLEVKNLPANARDIRDMRLIPASRRSLEERHGKPLQYSYLEKPVESQRMDTIKQVKYTQWKLYFAGHVNNKINLFLFLSKSIFNKLSGIILQIH